LSYNNPFDNGDNLPPGATQAMIDAHFAGPDEDPVQQDEIDPIMQELEAQHAAIASKARLWLEVRAQLLPLVKDLILLGCDVNMSDSDLNCRFTGDKQKFLRVVRVQFRHGMRPDLSSLKKGATEGYWSAHVGELRVWTSFSSTQCRRVQIGTKLEEVPIYETRCDSLFPDSSELPGFQSSGEMERVPQQSISYATQEVDEITF